MPDVEQFEARSDMELPGEERQAGQTAITIAGMHRSGTSALAGTLSLLGAEAPKTLFSDHWNPKGHFESTPIIKVSNAVLKSAGLEVEDWGAVPHAWPTPTISADFASRFAEVIREQFDKELIIVKDPRFCRFPKLIAEGLARAGWKPVFVLIHRDPIEVAQSLGRRNGFPLEHNLLMWLRSVLDAERGTRGYPRAIFSYELLLADWRQAIDLIENRTGVLLPSRSTRAEAAVDSFLEAELRHFRTQGTPLGTALQDWLTQTQDAYVSLSNDPQNISAMATLDCVDKSLTEASRWFHGLVCRLTEARPATPATSPGDKLAKTATEFLREAQAKNEHLISRVNAAVDLQVTALHSLSETLSAVPKQIVAEQSARLRRQEEFWADKLDLLKERLAARERALAASFERTARAEAAHRESEATICSMQETEAQRSSLRTELGAEIAQIAEGARLLSEFVRAVTKRRFLITLALSSRELRVVRLAQLMEHYHLVTEHRSIVLEWLGRRRAVLGLLRRSRDAGRALVSVQILTVSLRLHDRLWQRVFVEDPGHA